MSLARDDFGYMSAIDAIETSFLKATKVEKKEDETNISGPQNKEPEINDVYEGKTVYTRKDPELEKLQEDYNQLEEKNQELKKIQSDLEQIDKALKKEEETTEEDTEEADKEKAENLKKDEEAEAAEEKGQALEKINTLMSGVREKQSQIAEMQREIQQTVSSIVELNVGENADSIEAEMQKAEELKASVINEIRENPETVKKLQIKNIDRNLLLAMISLRH